MPELKVTLVVRSTKELHKEIDRKRESLRSIHNTLIEAQKHLERAQNELRNAEGDVKYFKKLKSEFEDRLGELQFQLGQNDVYEQMLNQGITAEPSD